MQVAVAATVAVGGRPPPWRSPRRADAVRCGRPGGVGDGTVHLPDSLRLQPRHVRTATDSLADGGVTDAPWPRRRGAPANGGGHSQSGRFAAPGRGHVQSGVVPDVGGGQGHLGNPAPLGMRWCTMAGSR